jgi:enoyl-CoA hydratase/carnithine racemase
MTEYETVLVHYDDGVAWVSLNRPQVRNAFNTKMQAELRELWSSFRYDDDVRCVVLSGEGDAFCTGIDRTESMTDENMETDFFSAYPTPWMYDDPAATSARSRTTSGSR